jgi:multicomponent K+:H+ antiporter subunit F
MSAVLSFAIFFTLGCYAVASVLVLARLVRGPRAQDRVFALEVLGIHHQSDLYFEAALLIALFGFVSSSAMAKFILRGEVIE